MKFFTYIFIFLSISSTLSAEDAKYACSQLFEALKNGQNTADIEKLFAKCSDPAARDKQGNTFLHNIARSNHPQKEVLIDMSIKHGADINAKNDNGKTPLFHALYRPDNIEVDPAEDIESLATLLKYKANPNIQDKWGNIPLHEALNVGPLLAIQALVAAGSDISKKNDFGETPLSNALKEDRSLFRFLFGRYCPFRPMMIDGLLAYVPRSDYWWSYCAKNKIFLAPLLTDKDSSPSMKKINKSVYIMKNIISSVFHRNTSSKEYQR